MNKIKSWENDENENSHGKIYIIISLSATLFHTFLLASWRWEWRERKFPKRLCKFSALLKLAKCFPRRLNEFFHSHLSPSFPIKSKFSVKSLRSLPVSSWKFFPKKKTENFSFSLSSHPVELQIHFVHEIKTRRFAVDELSERVSTFGIENF